MFKFFALLIALQGALGATVVTDHLQRSLQSNNAVNIFVNLKDNTFNVLSTIQASRFADRSVKLNALHSALTSHAEKTQEPIHRFLSTLPQTFEVKVLWITNQIYIRNASPSLVSQLADNFSNLIASIDEEFFAELYQPVSIMTNVTINQEHQWGVVKIQAPEAWQELGGVDRAGEGVIVGTVDTGVRGTHEALRNNFVGEYGWFDPALGTLAPTDNSGHGTHSTGTICGGNGIGVAPGAKWAACKGCTMGCPQKDLLACGQFFMCPTLANGSNPDCSKAPHLVSNSWGGGRGNEWYDGVIEAYHTAGIIPVFSIGNMGPDCSTSGSPGDRNVIGVGSTDDADAISDFSGVGPTPDARIKPDVCAPGSSIVSAYHTSDTAYATISGTSMATPHAAGTVALLLTRNKQLSYQQTKQLLFENIDQNLTFSGKICKGIGDNVFPNYVFGNGRINAFKAVKIQSHDL